jgi:hypothetical protein
VRRPSLGPTSKAFGAAALVASVLGIGWLAYTTSSAPSSWRFYQACGLGVLGIPIGWLLEPALGARIVLWSLARDLRVLQFTSEKERVTGLAKGVAGLAVGVAATLVSAALTQESNLDVTNEVLLGVILLIVSLLGFAAYAVLSVRGLLAELVARG